MPIPRPLAGALLALLLAHPALALPKPLPTVAAMRGEAVSPRSFELRNLPRVDHTNLSEVRLEKTEGVNPEADAELDSLKALPHRLTLTDLRTLTVDGANRGAQPFAVTVGNSFEGITQGPYIPSEPSVGAGPLNVFTAGNVSVTVTNKDGSNRVETDGASFFGVPAAEGAISDAQSYYDALRGRFVAIAFTQGTSPSNFSNFYLAISKTNDARGAWWLYKFDMTKDGTTPTSNWSDYESIGVSDDKMAMTGQQFTFSGDSYVYQKIRVIDRAAAYSGGTVTYFDFVNFSAPSGQQADFFVTKAARNLSAGDNTLHCLCVRTNGGSNVTYREVTGPPSAPTLTTGFSVPVSAYSAPPDAPQKGSSRLVATNDCRPTDFYVRNGVLTCAWHTAATISSTSVSAIRLFQLRTSDHAVLTDETYGAASTFYYYPAATVDSLGTIYLGFDRSSTTEFPSCYGTGKRRGDATLEPSTLLKAGVSATSQTRWGDFTCIDNDATLTGPGGSTAWYAGQFTKGTNTFGTWINRLSFSYGQVAGVVNDDCDGATGTILDRTPLAGVTVALLQGATTLATTSTDATGAYNFGYLESGTYDVVVTPPAGGGAVDAAAGTGATSQVRVSATDIQVVLANSQTSTGNAFAVTSVHAMPSLASIAPAAKFTGDPAFALTLNGSGFTTCSTALLDGVARVTTYLGATQLSAAIPASDLLTAGTHTLTVSTPAPGGGTSGGQTLTVTNPPDHTPPMVAITAPAGGESWSINSAQAITWTASDNVGVTAIDLAYSLDGGATFPNAIASGLANSGSYAWTVPMVITSTARVRVTAHDAAGNAGADSSHTNVTFAGWTITASAGPDGTIAPPGASLVGDGGALTYTITPNASHHVSDVLVDSVSVGAVTSYPFTNVTANHSIAASFAPDPLALITNVIGAGGITRSPNVASPPYGTLVTLTAVPAPAWSFAGWSGDTVTTGNPLAFTLVATRTFTATFVDTTPPTVSVLAPNGGEVLGLGATTNLTWSASDAAGIAGIDLYLSRAGAGGPFDSLAAGLPNTGSYSWTVTGPSTADAFLKAVARDSAGNNAFDVSDAAFSIVGSTGVESGAVTAFALSPVRPNPARGGAQIGFALPREAHVRLSVLDVQGREVALLADGAYAPGWHHARIGGPGASLEPGLYFARYRTPVRTYLLRFVVMR